MRKAKYIVYDTTNRPVGVPFNSYEDAATYKIIYGRQDWKIVTINQSDILRQQKRVSTQRQRAAVKYCCAWLEIEFDGDINNFYDCSDFLSEYLDSAKDKEDLVRELACEYESEDFGCR